jgi:5'-phosphate synthase pdxT subunit
MDIRTKRNAFGPQRASFEADIAVPALGEDPFHAVFIRAPVVESTGAGVEVMARLDEQDGAGDATIVAVRQGHLMGTAFHPEVTGDTRFHDYFLRLVRGVRG